MPKWVLYCHEILTWCILKFVHSCIFYSFYCGVMQFLETNPDLGNHYNEVIAPQDIATYGGLCALATFDRAELKVYIIFFLFDHFFWSIPRRSSYSSSPTWLADLCFNCVAEQGNWQYKLQEFPGVSAWNKRAYQWLLLKVIFPILFMNP